jgi:hypothetical protein
MVELVNYSISYGECVGYCTSVLTIDGSAIELVQTSDDPGEPPRRFTGVIDADLGGRISRQVAILEQDNLSEVYGTPDARDEGAVTMQIRGGSGVTEHTYSRGGPPSGLSNLDDLLSPISLGWIDGEAIPGVILHESP